MKAKPLVGKEDLLQALLFRLVIATLGIGITLWLFISGTRDPLPVFAGLARVVAGVWILPYLLYVLTIWTLRVSRVAGPVLVTTSAILIYSILQVGGLAPTMFLWMHLPLYVIWGSGLLVDIWLRIQATDRQMKVNT